MSKNTKELLKEKSGILFDKTQAFKEKWGIDQSPAHLCLPEDVVQIHEKFAEYSEIKDLSQELVVLLKKYKEELKSDKEKRFTAKIDAPSHHIPRAANS